MASEVDTRYPFDEESERKLLTGKFASFDANRLRGIRDRGTAQHLLVLHQQIAGRTPAEQERRRRERERLETSERFQALRRMCSAMRQGNYGAALKAKAQDINDQDLLELEWLESEARKARDEWSRKE